MLGLAAGLMLLLQAQAPRVQVSADRPRVALGEIVTVTIAARSSDPRPVTIAVNPPDGLSVVDRQESSDSAAGPDGVASATLTLRLRAMEPGRWPVGPIRVMVGGTVTDVDGVVVDVGDPPEVSVLVTNPRLRQLLQRAPPPKRSGDVVLRLITSADTVRTGGQVDVVAAAWFPRGLRLQLRRPPVLQPPVIGGVWSRAQGTGSGLVTSRRIGDEWYDLFVAHQIVFPLAAGTITVPRALLRFGSPASPDEQTELYDGPRTIVALPMPVGAPAGFAGAVGTGLRVTRRVDGEARAGAGLTVEFTVSGRGNASLWPAPEIVWPAGARAYPDGTTDDEDVIEGRLGGSKTFRFSVVPARAGALALPVVRYPYFDPLADAYREARVEAGAIAVRPADPRAGTAPRLTLIETARVSMARQVARAIPAWLWVLLAALPIALPWLHRRRAPPPVVRGRVPGEVRLRSVLADLVGDVDERMAAAGLRARGATPADVAAVERVRTALAAAAYGPAAGGVPPSLAREAEQLAERLEALQQAQRPSAVRRTVGGAAVLLLLGLGALQAMLPADGAEAAYVRGDFSAAASKFLARTAANRNDATPWYNLGAASLAAGDETAAAAAFVRAARRAPRDPQIRAALALAPTTDRSARDARTVPPIAADEAALLGLVIWWFGWAALRWQRSARRTAVLTSAVLLLATGGALLAGGGWLRWREARPIGLVRETGPLRRSPHERGDALGDLAGGAAVELGDVRGGWRLVRAPVGDGWVPAARLVSLAE